MPKKLFLRILHSLIAVFILFIGLIVIPYFTNTLMPWDRSHAVETALLWGGLSELPNDANIKHVGTDGNMFSRTFIVEFSSNKEEIDKWISTSKGLKEVIPEAKNGGILIYRVKGYEGSIGGIVRIDNNNVKIYMSWS